MTECSDSSYQALGRMIAHQINESPYAYRPKRRCALTGYSGVIGWHDRLLGYRYRTAQHAFHDWQEISDISAILCRISQILNEAAPVSDKDRALAVETTLRLFKWGGVLRGRGHNPPSFDDIERVMTAAATYRLPALAPMDSAWTKLAALSSIWKIESALTPPQVIYDSRVSVALAEAIDSACERDPALIPARDRLRREKLGYVSGRGGNRADRTRKLAGRGWRSAYGKWEAQFAASRLVAAIVDALNSDSSFEPMPTPDGRRAWNTRGVEMVLFMDGY